MPISSWPCDSPWPSVFFRWSWLRVQQRRPARSALSAPASFSPSATPAETASTDPTASDLKCRRRHPPAPSSSRTSRSGLSGHRKRACGTGSRRPTPTGVRVAAYGHRRWLRSPMCATTCACLPGYVVRASLGPLVVDDTAWYAVGDVPQAGEPTTADSLRIWRTVSPAEDSANAFSSTRSRLHSLGRRLATERPATECPCFGDYPGPTVIAPGVGEGDGRGPTWQGHRFPSPPRHPRRLTLASSVCWTRWRPVYFDESAVDYLQGQIPGVMPAADAGPDAELWLDILGDCAWAVTVELPQG